jgi:hypothetical protein
MFFVLLKVAEKRIIQLFSNILGNLNRNSFIMKKLATISALFCLLGSGVAQSIDPEVKTIGKTGGSVVVQVTATGEWTSETAFDWITLYEVSKSGNGSGKVIYTASRNTTADTREGTIKIGDATHRVVQEGQVAQISPSLKKLDHLGGGGSVSITVAAGVEWTAVVNDNWIKITSEAFGMSNGSIDYTVDAYSGVEKRTGSLTVAGKTFTVTQTGRDVVLTPEVIEKGQGADIVLFTVSALDKTNWTVEPLDTWIDVIDAGPGFGDGNVTLSIAANPSFLQSTGRVQVNDAVLVIKQKGISSPTYAINPASVEAPGNGAFGLVTVSATPDAPWIASPKVPWITITENPEGSGNANVKYVISVNPLPEERSGSIVLMPNNKRQFDDYARGLLMHLVNYHHRQVQLSGFDQTGSGDLANKDNTFFFDNSHSREWGESLFKLSSEKSLTISGLFYPYYIERVNHFLELKAGQSVVGLTSSEAGVLQLSINDKLHDTGYSLLVKQWQVFIVRYHEGAMKVYAALQGKEAKEVLSVNLDSQDVARINAGPERLTLGQRETLGYYTGQAEDFRFYGRALSDSEISGYDKSVQNTLHPYWVGPDYELYTYRKEGNYSKGEAYALLLEGEHLPRPEDARKAWMLNDLIDPDIDKWIDLRHGENDANVFDDNSSNFYIGGQWVVHGHSHVHNFHWINSWDWGGRSSGLVANENGRWHQGYRVGNDANVFVVGKKLPLDVELGAGLVQKHYYKGNNSYLLNKNGAKIGTSRHTAQNVLADKGMNGFNYGSLNFSHDHSRVLHQKTNAYGASSNCTLSFWVKFNSLNDGRIIYTYTEGGARGGHVDRIFALDLIDSKTLLANFQHRGGENNSYVIDKIIPKDEWSMITLTESRDGNNHNFKFYLNDKFIFEKDIRMENSLILSNNESNSEVYFGQQNIWNHGSRGDDFSHARRSARMNLAEFSIYDKTLDKAGVAKLYRAKIGPVLVHQVTQKASFGTLSKTSTTIPAAGSADFVDIEISSKTNWKAESAQDWITPINSDTRSGNGRVDFDVDANDSVYPRTGSIEIAGNSIVVNQLGYNSSLETDSSQFGPDGGGSQLKVQTEAGAIWTAESDSDWVTILEPNLGRGKGPGTVFFVLDTYSSPVLLRTATLTIAGLSHVVTQNGYELSVDPLVAEIEGNSGSLTLTVTAPIGAVWEAITTTPWITIVGDQTRMGSGRLDYVVTQNETGETRTGSIIIGSQNFSLVQKSSTQTLKKAHPADKVPSDFIIGVSEATGYGAAWKKGEDWELGHTPLLNYATRAGMLWRKSENYDYDSSLDPPMCWIIPAGDGGNGGRWITKMSGQESPINLAGGIEEGVIRVELDWQGNFSCQAFELVLPDNLKVKAVSHDGFWDTSTGKVRWGPFIDRKNRTLSVSLDGKMLEGSVSRIIRSADGLGGRFALMHNRQPIHIPDDSPKLVYQSKNQLMLFGQPGGRFTIQFVDRLNDPWLDLKEVRLDEWQTKLQLAPESTGTRFYRALRVD